MGRIIRKRFPFYSRSRRTAAIAGLAGLAAGLTLTFGPGFGGPGGSGVTYYFNDADRGGGYHDPGFVHGEEGPPEGWTLPDEKYRYPIPKRVVVPGDRGGGVPLATLRIQVNRADALGWRKLWRMYEKQHEIPKGLMFAIASRETGMQNRCGDGDHGHGVFQVDDRYWADELRSWGVTPGAVPCEVPRIGKQSHFAAHYLVDAREFGIANGVPEKLGWRFAIAAYNAGFYGALWGWEAGNLQKYTAHGNYVSDVLYRKKRIRYILADKAAKQRRFLQPSIELDARHLVAQHGAHVPVRIILHSTESSNQEGVRDLYNIGAYWSTNGLGAHLGVDDEGNTALYIDFNRIGWHVAGRNTGAIGIEMVGTAHWTYQDWVSRPKLLNEVARWLAYLSRTYDIPLVRDPYHGVSTHNDQSQLSGGGHWDPGPGFPFNLVLGDAKVLAEKGWRS